jgi:glycosyltransferase involved in cell wall biosynthesis
VEGIDVIEFDLSYSNKDGFLKRTASFLKYAFGSIGVVFSQPHDLVFATSTPLTASLPGIVARWIRRKPFVFEVRDLWPELPREMGVIRNPIVLGAMSVLEKLSYVSAQRCIALSPGIAQGIARRGIASNRIEMIPNGCDIDLFADIGAVAWRPDSIPQGNLLAVFAGTHGQANGLDAVLDAAKVLLQRKRNDISILLIGDGKLKPALQQRAEAEGLLNVVFHDPVNKAALAGLMSDTDIGLQCLANVPAFYYGTSPNKFFDYAASGVPVLCNYPGWIADMIEQGDCGYAVPPENPEAFASALEAAADDAIARKQKGVNIAGLARREFDRTMLADKWTDWVVGGERA